MDEKRTQQEYEFVLEGITTRMQMAMEKITECNRALRAIVKYVCAVMLAVVIIVVSGFVINNVIMINHINGLRGGEAVTQGGAVP